MKAESVPGAAAEVKSVPGAATEATFIPGAAAEGELIPGAAAKAESVPGAAAGVESDPEAAKDISPVLRADKETSLVPGANDKASVSPGLEAIGETFHVSWAVEGASALSGAVPLPGPTGPGPPAHAQLITMGERGVFGLAASLSPNPVCSAVAQTH